MTAPDGEVGRFLSCSCGHNAARHRAGRTPGCTGLDSYACPCSCPSFELSQGCAETMLPAELHQSLAYLTERGLDVGPHADLLCRFTQ